MRRYKCNRTVVDKARILEIEPAFAERIDDIVGATYTAEDESGDAHKYTQQLAAVCERMGADFRYDADAVALHSGPGKSIAGVEIQGSHGYETLRARDYIVSLGSYSAPFLRRFGVRLNIYPSKGYSVTIPIAGANAAPVTSLTDDQYKLVYSNLGDRLRVAGTAELSGYTKWLDLRRCHAILNNVKGCFPAPATSTPRLLVRFAPDDSLEPPLCRAQPLPQSLAEHRSWHAWAGPWVPVPASASPTWWPRATGRSWRNTRR
jgi:D-amino-acid dehydrogenase